MSRPVPLTMDRQLAAVKPGERPCEYRVGGSRGMTLRVFPSGFKQFELRYTTRAGVRRRHVLGSYPDLSLAKARSRAAALRLAIADGEDPVADNRQERARVRAGETLNELAEEYWTAAEVGLHGRNEIAGAMKAEFDLTARQWTIPSTRAKAKHQHVVPLGPESIAILEKAFAQNPESPFVFPSSRVADQPIETRGLTRAFARICAGARIPLGSPHDVRRSGATTLTGRYGVSRLVVSLVLGHTPNEGAAVTAVYDRHTYLPEKRAALELWEGHLSGRPVQSGVAENLPKPVRASTADRAELRALSQRLVEAGDLHRAVLQMSMGLARSGEMSASHLDILAAAGMDMAHRGAKDEIVHWLDGF